MPLRIKKPPTVSTPFKAPRVDLRGLGLRSLSRKSSDEELRSIFSQPAFEVRSQKDKSIAFAVAAFQTGKTVSAVRDLVDPNIELVFE